MNQTQTLSEALYTAKELRSIMNQAYRDMGSASNWGFVDILGGGLLTTFLKHRKIASAERVINQAKRLAIQLEGLMNNLDPSFPIKINIGNILIFADYLLDNGLVDIFVQSKIMDSRRQIKNYLNDLDNLIQTLENYL